jgi:Copper resistance protein D
VWLGGLVTLLVVGRTAVATVSRNALAAVTLLAVSGVLRALTELRAFDQLWTTSYGRALLVKSALFVPLVALGFVNRTRLLALFDRLRRNVRVELVLLAVVVGTVTVLVQLRPGKAAPRAATQQAITAPQPPALPHAGVVDARELGALAVALARTPTAATVTLLGPDGTGASGRAVRIDGRAATPCGAGCYRAPAPSGPVRVTVDGRALTFEVAARAPSARAMLARATRLYRGARTIVFTESLRSSPSAGVVSRFEVVAPDGLRYTIRGGPQAVVIGTRRWDRDTPTGQWQESQQTRLDVTQPYWRHPTSVHLVAPRTLTFMDRTIPAWFRLTLDAQGRPRTLHMTAAAHFMRDDYARYGVPVVLSPPSR